MCPPNQQAARPCALLALAPTHTTRTTRTTHSRPTASDSCLPPLFVAHKGTMFARTMMRCSQLAPRAAFGAGALAFGAAAFATPPAQAKSSIPEMLAQISAKVEALESKMAAGGGSGGSSGDSFGNFSCAGKNVIITGGASGIGLAICEIFAKRGANVYLLDLFPEPTMKAAAELRAQTGGNVTGIPCNVANHADVTAAFDTVKSKGRVDILVNNAGVAAVGNVEKCTEADMDRVYSVNIKGVFYGCQEAAKAMTGDNKGGVIVNLASIASLIGIKDRFAYSMTKGAVLTMTYSMATDYMHKGIRCNAIAPTRVHTPFVDGFIKKNYPGKEVSSPRTFALIARLLSSCLLLVVDKAEVFEKLSKFTPLGRMAEPKEIAAAVYFLCTPEAAMIQGECFNVDGGVVSCMDAQEM